MVHLFDYTISPQVNMKCLPTWVLLVGGFLVSNLSIKNRPETWPRPWLWAERYIYIYIYIHFFFQKNSVMPDPSGSVTGWKLALASALSLFLCTNSITRDIVILSCLILQSLLVTWLQRKALLILYPVLLLLMGK